MKQDGIRRVGNNRPTKGRSRPDTTRHERARQSTPALVAFSHQGRLVSPHVQIVLGDNLDGIRR